MSLKFKKSQKLRKIRSFIFLLRIYTYFCFINSNNHEDNNSTKI